MIFENMKTRQSTLSKMSIYSFWIGPVYPYLGKRLHDLGSRDFLFCMAYSFLVLFCIRMSSCVVDGPSEF